MKIAKSIYTMIDNHEISFIDKERLLKKHSELSKMILPYYKATFKSKDNKQKLIQKLIIDVH